MKNVPREITKLMKWNKDRIFIGIDPKSTKRALRSQSGMRWCQDAPNHKSDPLFGNHFGGHPATSSCLCAPVVCIVIFNFIIFMSSMWFPRTHLHCCPKLFCTTGIYVYITFLKRRLNSCICVNFFKLNIDKYFYWRRRSTANMVPAGRTRGARSDFLKTVKNHTRGDLKRKST